MKKGEIEIQFNWILVLVAGAVLFLFFFSIVNWAKDSSEESSSATTSSYVDSILTSSVVRKDTINRVSLPLKSLEMSCGGFRVDGAAGQKNFRNKIVFAPSEITDPTLVLWSVPWDAPFHVTNVLAVSSDRIKYVIRGSASDEALKEIEKKIPTELKVVRQGQTLENENDKQVRFVYVNQEPSDADARMFSGLEADKVTAVKIDSLSSRVKFYKKTPVDNDAQFVLRDEQVYVGDALMFGSIFADTAQEYECSLKRALKRLGKVAKIYELRSEELRVHYASDVVCQSIHADAVQRLLRLVEIGDQARDEFLPDLSQIPPLVQRLNQINKDAQINSCALVY